LGVPLSHKYFTLSETQKDNPSFVFRCFTARDSQSLSPLIRKRRRRRSSLLKEIDVYNETLNSLLNNTSVWPRNCGSKATMMIHQDVLMMPKLKELFQD